MEYKVVILRGKMESNLDLWESTITKNLNEIAAQGWQFLQLVVVDGKLVAVFSKIK